MLLTLALLCVSLCHSYRILPTTRLSRRSLDELSDITFEPKTRVELPDGTVLVRNVQFYKGIPVWGLHTTDHLSDTEFLEWSGSILTEIGNDIPDSEIDGPRANWEALIEPYSCSPDTIVHTEGIEYDEDHCFLVTKVTCMSIPDNHVIKRWRLEFEAVSGELIRAINSMDEEGGRRNRRFLQEFQEYEAFGGNVLTGKQTHTVRLTSDGTTCTYSTDKVTVVNQQGSESYNLEDAWSFPCADLPDQTDEINGGFSPLNDAHAYAEATFDMFNEWYGMDPLPFKLSVRVHYSTNYDNAFWNGVAMFFGDGASYFHPLVSLSVMAHEVAHGTTDHFGGDMIYAGESGGMNEAFSDMASAAAEQYFFQTTEYNIGDNIKQNGGSLRYMCDPPQDGSSIGHQDDYYNDMDVHYSSGIFNKAFCILSKMPGWGPQKTFHLFLTANMAYWDTDTTFNEAGTDSVHAANDLGYSVDDVCSALGQVGVAAVGCPGVATPGPTMSPTSGPTKQCDYNIVITAHTGNWAYEMTWDLDGFCAHTTTDYENEATYTHDCCVADGEWILTCHDSYGDGWNGGYLDINGVNYCGEFGAGNSQTETVILTSPEPETTTNQPTTSTTTAPPVTAPPSSSTAQPTPSTTVAPPSITSTEEPQPQEQDGTLYSSKRLAECGGTRHAYWDQTDDTSFQHGDILMPLYIAEMVKSRDEQNADALNDACQSLCDGDNICEGYATASAAHWDQETRGFVCALFSDCIGAMVDDGHVVEKLSVHWKVAEETEEMMIAVNNVSDYHRNYFATAGIISLLVVFGIWHYISNRGDKYEYVGLLDAQEEMMEY